MNKIKLNNTNNKTSEYINNFKFHFTTSSLRHLVTLLLFSIAFTLPTWSFEDALVMTNGKMTNIKIQHNDIIDVFPLITIMNDKNTLIVHPLKIGKTKFSLIKNEKEKFIFDVNVTEDTTLISSQDGFEIMNIDCPPGSFVYYFNLDKPPIYDDYADFIENLDTPPEFKHDETESVEFPPELRGIN